LRHVSENGPNSQDANFYLIVNCALTDAQRAGIRSGLAHIQGLDSPVS